MTCIQTCHHRSESDHQFMGAPFKDKSNRAFLAARDFARSLGLKSKRDWMDWTKANPRPDRVPIRPDIVFRDQGWLGWSDFLGSENLPPRPSSYLSYEEARAIVREAGVKTTSDWLIWSKSERPKNVPSSPYRAYRGTGWTNWPDFFGDKIRN